MSENLGNPQEVKAFRQETEKAETARDSRPLTDAELLEAHVYLPAELFHFPRGDWHLFYDQQNHVWVRVNESGRQLVELFQENARIETVVDLVCTRFNAKPGDIRMPVLSFVRNMIESHFFFLQPYVVKDLVYKIEADHPKNVYYSNTERCNLKCVYCYNSESREEYGRLSDEMTTQQQFDTVDKLSNFKVQLLAFCGGEPLCRKDVFDVAQYAKNKGMYTALVTNGTLVSKEMVPRIVDLFDLVWVSLDSHIKEEHELLRGKGSFEPTMRTLRWFSETRPKQLIVNSVVCKLNYKSMPDMKRLMENELGVTLHRASTYVPVKPIRDKNNNLMESILDDESVKYLEEQGVQISLGGDELPAIRVDERDGLVVKQANRRIQCGFGSGDMLIVSNGDVYPCVMMYKEGFCAGNVLKDKLEDVYRHSSVMNTCRESTVDAIPECSNCVVKYVCAGGCRAWAYELYGGLKAFHRDLCPLLKKSAVASMWKDAEIPLYQVQKAKELYKHRLDRLKAEGKIPAEESTLTPA